jgi:hypothetical protein
VVLADILAAADVTALAGVSIRNMVRLDRKISVIPVFNSMSPTTFARDKTLADTPMAVAVNLCAMKHGDAHPTVTMPTIAANMEDIRVATIQETTDSLVTMEAATGLVAMGSVAMGLVTTGLAVMGLVAMGLVTTDLAAMDPVATDLAAATVVRRIRGKTAINRRI